MTEEEANKNLEKAKMALQDKEYEEARKFILKSLQLKNTEKGYKLLAECEAKLKDPNTAKTPKDSNYQPQPHPSENQNKESSREENTSKNTENESPSSKTEEEKKEGTDEDKAVCDGILGKSNYYEILGVQQNASEEEIKKQYKKLALKLHPDKNRAPQATEAFKKIAQALNCLTNPNKRRIYDEHGSEENFRAHYREFFQDEEQLDPEDIFDLLINGSNNRNRQRRYYGPRGNPDPRQAQQMLGRGKYLMLIQFVPILVMFIFMFISQYKGTADPGFSITPTDKYLFKKTTNTLDLDYYVDSKFEETYDTQAKRLELEKVVLKFHGETLYKECAKITRLKVQLEERKYQSRSNREIEEIENHIEELDWTNCKMYHQIRDILAEE